MTIIVIERDNRIYNPEARDRFIGGSPCSNFDSVRELVFAHCDWGNDISASYVNNGTNYIEINRETGEIEKEYFARVVDI